MSSNESGSVAQLNVMQSLDAVAEAADDTAAGILHGDKPVKIADQPVLQI